MNFCRARSPLRSSRRSCIVRGLSRSFNSLHFATRRPSCISCCGVKSGYRSSVVGENSGGGASAETAITFASAAAYTVTIGGAGSNSVFSNITSTAGGNGGGTDAGGNTGGSGGGAGGSTGTQRTRGAGTTNQGYIGGFGAVCGSVPDGGGGGGAGAAGGNGSCGTGGVGGAGVASSITGSSVTRAGGGGGAAWNNSNTPGTGGAGGGGRGRGNTGGSTEGTANTGSGGGGASSVGGSGIVVIRYPNDYGTGTVGAGLTSTTGTYTAGGVEYRFYSFTAGTGTFTMPSF